MLLSRMAHEIYHVRVQARGALRDPGAQCPCAMLENTRSQNLWKLQLFTPRRGEFPLRLDHLYPDPQARLSRKPLASSSSSSSFHTWASWLPCPDQGRMWKGVPCTPDPGRDRRRCDRRTRVREWIWTYLFKKKKSDPSKGEHHISHSSQLSDHRIQITESVLKGMHFTKGGWELCDKW